MLAREGYTLPEGMRMLDGAETPRGPPTAGGAAAATGMVLLGPATLNLSTGGKERPHGAASEEAVQAEMGVMREDLELLRTALDEVRWLVASGRIAPPDAMYLGRKAMRPELDELLPRSGESTGVRIITPGFSYKTTAYLLWRRGAIKLLSSGYEGKLIPVDDFLALTYANHEAQVGVARPDLDELFADAPRINMLAVRPSLCRERRGISATENSPLLSEDPKAPRAKTK